MTDADWNNATDPDQMLKSLGGSSLASERKLRLFAAAVCRRVWRLLGDHRSRKAVEVAERFADGLATKEELAAAHDMAKAASADASDVICGTDPLYDEDQSTVAAFPAGGAVWSAAEAVCFLVEERFPAVTSVIAARSAGCAVGTEAAGNHKGMAFERAERRKEEAAQAAIVRDLFSPHPSRAGLIDPAWLSWNNGTVRRLALAVYEQRQLPSGYLDPVRLAILVPFPVG